MTNPDDVAKKQQAEQSADQKAAVGAGSAGPGTGPVLDQQSGDHMSTIEFNPTTYRPFGGLMDGRDAALGADSCGAGESYGAVVSTERRLPMDSRALSTGLCAGLVAIGISNLVTGSDVVPSWVMVIAGLVAVVLNVRSLKRSGRRGVRWLLLPSVVFPLMAGTAILQLTSSSRHGG